MPRSGGRPPTTPKTCETGRGERSVSDEFAGIDAPVRTFARSARADRENVWRTSFRFRGGKLVRATAEGEPPPELLGPEPLAFR